MEAYEMTNEQMKSYAEHLRMEECSESTVQKYANALTAFYEWLGEDKSVTKERLLLWKAEIGAKNAASTVNVMISAVNSFFAFMSWNNLRVKQVKTQRRIYRDKDRELTKAEYMRLLNAAREKGACITLCRRSPQPISASRNFRTSHWRCSATEARLWTTVNNLGYKFTER